MSKHTYTPGNRLEICYYDESGYLETSATTPLEGKPAAIEVYAAGPDLYAALQGAYKEIRAWRDGLNRPDMNKAKVGASYVSESVILAALRKARGEE